MLFLEQQLYLELSISIFELFCLRLLEIVEVCLSQCLWKAGFGLVLQIALLLLFMAIVKHFSSFEQSSMHFRETLRACFGQSTILEVSVTK